MHGLRCCIIVVGYHLTYYRFHLSFNSLVLMVQLCKHCSSPPRVYRQVASLVGLQLVTSFIKVSNSLGQQRDTAQRQLNNEKKRKNDGQLSNEKKRKNEGPRVDVESLNKRLSMTHENITVMEDMMRKLFTG